MNHNEQSKVMSNTLRNMATGMMLLLPLYANAIKFEDISESSGVLQYRSETWGAAVGDLNGDGYPDIHITNHVKPSILLRNNGDRTLSDVSEVVDINKGWIDQYNRRIEEHGASWADFDNDGDLDLSTAHNYDFPIYINRGGRLHLYAKDVRADFRMETIWIDENNDGWLDLGMSAGSVLYPRGRLFQSTRGSIPLKQTGDGRCTFSTTVISDFNVDGRMDYTCGLFSKNFSEDGRAYTMGGGEVRGLPSVRPVHDAVAADFNGDLRPDLFMLRGALRPSDGTQVDANHIEVHASAAGTARKTIEFAASGPIKLWVDWNRGDWLINRCQPLFLGAAGHVSDGTNRTDIPGRFSEITLNLDSRNPAYHGLKAYNGCGAALGYFPNEGVWKLQLGGENSHYVYMTAESASGVTFRRIENAGINHGPRYPKMYLNRTVGFEDRSRNSGLVPEQCASVVAGDFDNDMDVDLYLACNAGSRNRPNVVYQNQGDGSFKKLSNTGGEGSVGPAWADGKGAGNSDSVVLLDVDVDGFLDVFVTNGLNLRPNRNVGPYNLLRNSGNSNNWLQFDLEGVQSNRDGIGAKLFLTTPDGKVQLREQNGGFHRWSQNSMRIHFGLARNASASLRVEWPSGRVDTINAIRANGLYSVKEGDNRALPVILREPPVAPCGPASIDAAKESGIFVWRNCRNLTWNVQVVGDATGGRYRGTLTLSSGNITSLAGKRLESNDVLRQINAQQVEIDLQPGRNAIDAFTFKTEGNVSNACLKLSDDAAQPYYIAADKHALRSVNGINIAAMRACNGNASARDHDGDGIFDSIDNDADNDGSANDVDAFPYDRSESLDSDNDGIGNNRDSDDDNDGVADTLDAFPLDPSENKDSDGDGIGDNADPYPLDPNNRPPASAACGEPSWSASSDRATFIWKDCSQNPAPWLLRVSGGSSPSKLVFSANIADNTALGNYQAYRLESNDIVRRPDANNLDYALTIYNRGVDGLSFTASDNGCFRATAPADLPVYIGAGRQLLDNTSRSFAFGDLAECPRYIDSDNDGLSDSDEATRGTNPNVADSDGGGINDGVEVRNGTDPLDGTDDAGAIDSDNDDLSDSRENALGTNPGNPDSDGDRLRDGEEVNIYKTDPLRTNTDRDGLSDWAEAKVFGTDPLKADSDGDGLNDGPERKTHKTDPLKADTDGGGVNDGTEIQNGTNPLDASDG